MNLSLLKGILSFIVLLLVQALVLNSIHLFGYATPLIYVYMVLLFPRNYSRVGELIACFVMGFCLDMFSNTPGVGMASMTFLGLIQPYILRSFLPRDSAEDFAPTMTSLGFVRYLYYSSILVIIYCALFFALEAFNFFDIEEYLLRVLGSAVITLIIIWAIENFREH